MLATIPKKITRIPQKVWLNLDNYKSKFKPSVLCDVPAGSTIEYLQDYEHLRVYQSGRIYDYE